MAPLHIGVLIVPPIQLLDLAPIDLLAMLSHSYFAACDLPQPLLDIAIPDSDLTITYISPAGAGVALPTTARVQLGIDVGIDDEKVKPGKLDVLMIPGPPPATKPDESVLKWIRAHVESGVDLLTVCTGAFVAGYAGVLDGRRAAGPRGVLDLLKRECPKVNWENRRWVNDGRIWTSGGISNGLDMVAVYIKQRWPGALSDTVLTMAEIEPRPREYDQGNVRWNAWFVWCILRAWAQGLTGRKTTEK